jgi:predicted transcriptional regulator
MSAWKNRSSHVDATAAIAEAVRLYGRARGWHMAAQLLGVTERTVRAITYGETTGATIPNEIAMQARATIRRRRAAEMRADLRDLENAIENEAADQAGAHLGVGR